MNSLDGSPAAGPFVPRGAHICGHVTGREGYCPPVIDVHPIRRILGKLLAVDCCQCTRDEPPRVRVRCRFAGEIAHFEFGESSLDVFIIEDDCRRDPMFGVEFDDAECVDSDRLWTMLAAREADAAEGEPLTAQCNN